MNLRMYAVDTVGVLLTYPWHSSFNNSACCPFTHVKLFVSHQAPLSMLFPRQEYWCVVISSSRGSCRPRDQTCISMLPALKVRFFTTNSTWEAPLQGYTQWVPATPLFFLQGRRSQSVSFSVPGSSSQPVKDGELESQKRSLLTS